MTPFNQSMKMQGIVRVLVQLLVAVGLLITPTRASASPGEQKDGQYVVRPEPSWVDPLKANHSARAPKEEISEGMIYLVVDEQVSVPLKTSYSHYAQEAIEKSGLESVSEVSIDFDPTFQRLVLHYVRLWRNGNPIDKLQSTKIKLIQREEGLEAHIYDGRLSALIFLDDVRVGDIVEYAYSLEGFNPIFGGRYARQFLVQWSVPVMQFRARILAPVDHPLQILNHRTVLQPVLTKSSSAIEYRWEKSNVRPVHSDDGLPSWFSPYGAVQVSQWKDWGEVRRWGDSLYNFTAPLAPDMTAKLDELKGSSSGDDLVAAILRFVQEDVRYLGIELGENSHRPNPPDKVFMQRFGDCKDKSVLLCSLLHAAGIEAYPALICTSMRDSLTGWLPSADMFDHCTVVLRSRDNRYWVDPTDSYQRGQLRTISYPRYGRALVIDGAGDSLTKIPDDCAGSPKTEIHEHFTVESVHDPVKLAVTTTYSGADADEFRAYLARASREEIEKEYLNFYADKYPDARQTRSLSVEDNDVDNNIVTKEEYSIGDFWREDEDTSRLKCSFHAESVRHRIRDPRVHIRTMPYSLPYPEHFTQLIEADLPHYWNFKREEGKITDDCFTLNYKFVPGKSVLFYYDYAALRPVVDTSHMRSYIAHVQQALDRIGFVLYEYKNPALQTIEDPETLGLIFLGILGVGFVAIIILSLFLYSRRETFWFSVGEAIRYGWSNLKPNFGFFAAALMLRVVSTIASLIAILMLQKEGDETLNLFVRLSDALLGVMVSVLFIRFALDTCEQRRSSVDSVLESLKRFFPVLAGSFCYIIIIAGGLLLLVVPGIYWAVRFQFYGYFIVDEQVGPLEGLARSWRATEGLGWNLLAFNLVGAGLVLAGLFAFGLGVFITVPLVVIATAYVYCLLTTEEDPAALAESAPMQSSEPAPVIRRCEYCQSEVQLNQSELEARRFTCPSCNNLNNIDS